MQKSNGIDTSPMLHVNESERLHNQFEQGSRREAIDAALASTALASMASEMERSYESSGDTRGLRDTLERVDQLAEAGVERSDFGGIEVRRAIEGYYTDHEVTLYALDRIVSGEGESGEVAAITTAGDYGEVVQNERFKKALQKIDELNQAGDITGRNAMVAALVDTLYTEPCIGQLTLDDETVQRVANKKAELLMTMTPYLSHEHVLDAQVGGIRAAGRAAGNEVRHAGQLQFHNTVYGLDMAWSGNLRGRDQQDVTQDVTRITTANIPEHSTSIHFSELLDTAGYKRETHQTGEQGTGVATMQAKTIAVPLGMIVERAPYARGLEYGAVQAKTDRDVQAYEVGLGRDSAAVGEIGPGASDVAGLSQPAIDRVFLASVTNESEAAQFDIPIHGAEIMRRGPDGVEHPMVYEIQSDSDRLANYTHAMSRDPSVVEEVRGAFAAGVSQREILDTYGQSIRGGGVGYGHPKVVSYADLKLSTQTPASEYLNGGAAVQLGGPRERGIDFSDEQRAIADPVVRAVQEQSVALFAGEYVVPLRAIDVDYSGRDEALMRRYGEKLDRELRYAA